DARKDWRIIGNIHGLLHQLKTGLARTPLLRSPLPLRAMHASPFSRDFVVGSAEIRIEFADIDADACLIVLVIPVLIVLIVLFVLIVAPVEIQFLCLPGLSIFGKPVGIGSNLERFLCDDAGHLMVPMAVAWCPRKAGDDDLRTKVSNDPYIIAEDLIVSPFR